MEAISNVNGVEQSKASGSVFGSFNLNDELKKKDIFTVGEQYPNINFQQSNSCIW